MININYAILRPTIEKIDNRPQLLDVREVCKKCHKADAVSDECDNVDFHLPF